MQTIFQIIPKSFFLSICLIVLINAKITATTTTETASLAAKEYYLFSYGGYMDKEQIRADLKYAPENMGVYKLEGYEFYYNRAPSGRVSTGGNVMPEDGKTVYGVLWKLKPEDFLILDSEEQAPEVYQRRELKVTSVKNPQISKIAQVYVSTPKYTSKKCFPRPFYVNLVLKGAYQNNLPSDYILKRLSWNGPWGTD
jgi:gamma-glutamylcyclotransferase